MSDLFTEDVHRPRAERYAAALAQAAAAEERIKALTETLADHEWHRSQAEAQVSAVEWDTELGKVWTVADGQPPADVISLLDLTTGQVYTRATWGGGTLRPNEWVRADRSERAQMLRQWPLEDAGPFIAFREDWGFADVIRAARRDNEAADEIRNTIRGLDGYGDPDHPGPWSGLPEIVGAVRRVVLALQDQRDDARNEVAQQRLRIRELEQRLALFEEAAEVQP